MTTTRRAVPSQSSARACGTALLAAATLAIASLPARAETVTEVRVERARPQNDKPATLRFLRENRDFLRGELDRLREQRVQREGGATAIDPRFLAYRDMVAQVRTERDSVTLAAATQSQRELLSSVTQLGDLESQLDQLDRTLAAQRSRLGILQNDFTGDQRTALAIVLSGVPQSTLLSQVAINLEDGSSISVPLSPEQLAALRQGGAVQVFHGYVEPREQVIEVSLAGGTAASASAGYVTLEPARDRLTLLRLDLSTVHDEGAAAIHATTWLNDARVP